MLPAFLMPALIGGGAGLLFNRKDPLKGALMGAGLGAAGGLLAPTAGAAGAAGGAAAEAAPAMTNGAFLGEGVASGVPAWEAAPTGGLLSGLKTAGQAVKPVAEAARMAQQAGLLNQDQPPMQAPPPMIQPGGGPQTLAQLAQMRNPTQAFESAQQERRQRRRGILGMA
jgi:hypothetical protein